MLLLRRAQLLRERLRLLPGREVAAFREPVEMTQCGICSLRPTLRGCINLVREDAHGDRDGDLFRGEEVELVLRVEAGRGDRRVRQPVERDAAARFDVWSGCR